MQPDLDKADMRLGCKKNIFLLHLAISLFSFQEHMQLSGLYLKIRILIKSHSPDEAIKSGEPGISAEIAVCAWYVFYPTNVSLNMFLPTSGLSELLDCEVPLEVCLSTVKLLVEEKRYDLSSLLIGTKKIVFLKSVVEKTRHMLFQGGSGLWLPEEGVSTLWVISWTGLSSAHAYRAAAAAGQRAAGQAEDWRCYHG